MLGCEIVREGLWNLLDEHARLHAAWKRTGDEQDRRLMAAAWTIAITHPGGGLMDDEPPQRPDAKRGHLCTPTVLSCHWLPAEGEDYWTMQDHLGFRGACLTCGWVGPPRRDARAENLAVEDAHDHSHPGWREIPVLPAPPSMETPTSYKQLVARWYERWGHLLPEGWLDRGGPVRTARSASASRHVAGRAPGGGYDLAAADSARETAGGQLCLL